ncbi:PAS domain S-box protein [Mucilaginibacter psychrotolerans]|uniref:histidine kinase n=1 Tax=Mucilaginibacter psychrotolerans TaxID=1524096 RepID=A0A4Y8SL23_9SPHI|nr:PAS domain S-box protein [Mucilaginibacter psychrotolerans]TFF39749.1 PAS domain S-box protein [Mucilaginibacter psychrotolerans]
MIETIKILYLEHNAGTVLTVSATLKAAGIDAKLKVVDNGPAFLEELSGFAPNLIIASDAFPALSAADALSALKQYSPAVPFMVLANEGTDAQQIVRLIKQGACDYILKKDIHTLPAAVLVATHDAAIPPKAQLTEQNYRQIVETAQEGIWIVDQDLITVFVNQKTCDILGYPAEEMIGRDKSDFRYNHNSSDTLARAEKRRQGIAETHESTFINKSGAHVQCIVATNGLFDADGKYTGSLAMLTDITGRKEHENALKHSEANLSAVIENTSDLVYSLDRNLKVITYNQLFKNTIKHVYGFDIFTGVSTLEMISGYDAEVGRKWENIYQRALDGETQQFVNEYTFGPEKVYLSYSINPIRESGQVIGLSCFSRDITKQKLDEAAIRKSEASLRTIFNNTDAACMLIDGQGNIVSFNNLAQQLSEVTTGCKIAEGSAVLDCIPTQNHAFVLEILENTRNGGVMHYQESRLIKGQAKWFDITWAGIKDQQYEDFGYIYTVKDVTDKKRLEIEREKITADLLQRNKALEQFTYIISHNLRAPVANIIGLSSLLSGSSHEDIELAEIVDSISRSADKLDDTILDLNRVLQVSQTPNEHIERIRLSKLVEDIKLSIRHLIEKEQVSIRADFETAEIVSLKSFIHSILYNLILNSIKYRNRVVSPEIVISAKTANGKITINFRDNGRGIDTSKYSEDIFGLYKRFDTSVEGKGIGLFMVKTQVESLGGTIAITSVLNKGTEFIINLPQQQLMAG